MEELIKVEVKKDHLDKISRGSVLNSLTELVWNAFDADANSVQIQIVKNDIGIQEVHVKDDGHGIPHKDSKALFSSLGGSWKGDKGFSPKGRYLHGKEGQGRFKAFAIGRYVEWNTSFSDGNQTLEYQIKGKADNKGEFQVFVPHAKSHSAGFDWSVSSRSGKQLSIHSFYIAKPTDSADLINAQLKMGKNLILTPGIYELNQSLKVSRPGTIVLGLGLPSLVPMQGTAAIEVADVSGVMLSGITIDAGPVRSNVLLKVGKKNSYAGAPHDPTTLSDIFVRVGGPRLGQATTSVEVNSNNVILDHSWLWRGDHGTGTTWDQNKADHGLVVNGNDVNALGLFVEHYQKHQVIWNGERGRTLFYQSEMPYDPPSQAAWMNGSKEGYASYVVGDNVRSHEATGLAIYSLFLAWQNVHASSAIEVPEALGVRLKSMTSAVIFGDGGIRHVVNNVGPAALAAEPNAEIYRMTSAVRLTAFPVAQD